MFGTQPTSKWNALDRLLYEAYRIYEDEISRDTGRPAWLTRSTDESVFWEVETRTDRATAALEDWDKKNPADKRKPGTTRTAVPYTLHEDGVRLVPMQYGGITRQQFSEAAIQEEQDIAREIDEDEIDFEIDRVKPQGGYNPADYGDG